MNIILRLNIEVDVSSAKSSYCTDIHSTCDRRSLRASQNMFTASYVSVYPSSQSMYSRFFSNYEKSNFNVICRESPPDKKIRQLGYRRPKKEMKKMAEKRIEKTAKYRIKKKAE